MRNTLAGHLVGCVRGVAASAEDRARLEADDCLLAIWLELFFLACTLPDHLRIGVVVADQVGSATDSTWSVHTNRGSSKLSCDHTFTRCGADCMGAACSGAATLAIRLTCSTEQKLAKRVCVRNSSAQAQQNYTYIQKEMWCSKSRSRGADTGQPSSTRFERAQSRTQARACPRRGIIAKTRCT